MRFALRPYQEEALDRVDAALTRGVYRQLGVAATGLGKTVIFCALAERRGGRTLILAHRDELITQAAAKVREVWPDADVGIVKAERDDTCSEVVVASVQTLARASRLNRLTAPFADDMRLLSRCGPFTTVVVDEAHHTAADSYRRILTAVGCDGDQPWARPLLFGVTATPDRGDGKGLDDLFDEIVFSYDILWGIRAGFLCDVRGLGVRLDQFNEADLRVSRGDYEAGAAGRLLSDAQAPRVIVAAWLEHARGRRTLAFTPTVALAQEVSDAFRAAGIAASMVHGGTPLDERRAILRAFGDGRLDVLANCAVLTEGYDEPRVDCIIVARPTKSRGLYTQMIGRGTRRHPDKADCLILDVVGASAQHSLVTIPSLFGLGEEFGERLALEPLTGVIDDFEREQVRLGKLRAEEVELFREMRGTGIAWVQVHKNGEPRRYTRRLGKDQFGDPLPSVIMAERPSGQWVAGLLYHDGTKRVLMNEVPMDLAQGVAEDYIRKHGARHLAEHAAGWRTKKPTPKQLAAAKRWRLTIDPGWNAGQLSDALDARIARIKMKKKPTKV